MKAQQIKENIKEKNAQELKKMLKEAKDALVSLKLDKEQNKLKDVRSVFHKRKEIARILTLIREKELSN